MQNDSNALKAKRAAELQTKQQQAAQDPYELSMMEHITMPEVRELLKSVEKIAIRTGEVDQRDLMLAPALFKKLMESRTGGLIQIQILVEGKPVAFEVAR